MNKLIQSIPLLGIQGLADVFVPEGLPLVDKAGAGPSTSVLVQGLAGTGKTTLAVAFGTSIASALGGRLLYVTTEVSPADLIIKLDVLNLALTAAFLQPSQRPHNADERVLGRTTGVSGEVTGIEQVLDAAWEDLESSAPEAPDWAIRCVIIDAAIFLASSLSPSERRALMDFIHACEGRGVSPIFVEETPESGTGASFLVDVVLHGFLARPTPVSSARMVQCTKSRFSKVLHGPHQLIDVGGRYTLSVDLFQQVIDAGRFRVPEAWQAFVPNGASPSTYGTSNDLKLPASFLEEVLELPVTRLVLRPLSFIDAPGIERRIVSATAGLNAAFVEAVRCAHEAQTPVLDIVQTQYSVDHFAADAIEELGTALVEAGFVVASLPVRHERPAAGLIPKESVRQRPMFSGLPWLWMDGLCSDLRSPLFRDMLTEEERADAGGPTWDESRVPVAEWALWATPRLQGLEGLHERLSSATVSGRSGLPGHLDPPWRNIENDGPRAVRMVLAQEHFQWETWSSWVTGWDLRRDTLAAEILQWSMWWLPGRRSDPDAWPAPPSVLWPVMPHVAATLLSRGRSAADVQGWLAERLAADIDVERPACRARIERIVLEAQAIMGDPDFPALDELGRSSPLRNEERGEIGFNTLWMLTMRGAISREEGRSRTLAVRALHPGLFNLDDWARRQGYDV